MAELTAQELQEALQELGIEPWDIDELVHEVKVQEASRINNEGLYAQLRWLNETIGSAELRQTLNERLGLEL
jgi:hypothetical protein